MMSFSSQALMASDTDKEPEKEVLVDKIVAIVNSDIITLYDIEKLLLPILPQLERIKDIPAKKRYLANLKKRVLSNIIDMNRVANIQIGNVDLNGFRNIARKTQDLHFSTHNIEHTAELDALGYTPGYDRYHHLDFSFHVDLIEIDMNKSA